MSVREIILLGNPVLREQCSLVKDVASADVKGTIMDLADTLQDFKKRRGFGRGIAAPQIGIPEQIIYLDFDLFKGVLINPKITKRSRTTFRLWDDCFSFPDLLAYVKRYLRVEVSYVDETGKRRKLNAEGALSELLQHEIDHLHGILAIDRAMDSKHIILRSEFEKIGYRTGVVF
jgi:peptide deformylase